MHRKTVRRMRRLIERPVASAIEPLESRFLLSLSATGGEFRANSATLGDQRSPSIAVDGDGDFVIAWQSSTGDASGGAVLAQRFNAAGLAQGLEFRVNTTTTFSQGSPSAAIDADGDFVITWGSFDGDDGGIFAQRYNSAGVAQGSEFRVNTFTTGNQGTSSVAMDATGDFVVAWTSYGQDGSYYGVYARRYNAAGVAQGTEFKVNSLTTNSQYSPKVAMNAAGGFVVAWSGYSSAAAGYDTYARRYNAAGTAQGIEFKVNHYTTGLQGSPSVAVDASGDFVVAWDSINQDGSSFGVYAQRYNALAVVQGVEFKVNTYTTSNQRIPSAAMDADGDFVVTWVSYQDGDITGIYAQAYTASGVPRGSEFKVNTYTTSKQFSPSAAMAPDGELVVAWDSNSQDGSSYGVYAQRYLALPVVGSVLIGSRSVLPYQVYEAPVAQIVVRFSENVTDSGGAGGVNSVTNPANWLITRNGVDVTAGLPITYGFNPATGNYEAELTFSQSYTSGNFLLKIRDNIRDITGNPLDGNLDGVPGGNFLLPFSVQGFGGLGEFGVNTYLPNLQSASSVAMDGAGDFVVVWNSYIQDDGARFGVYAQRYNSAGVAQGGEFRVNTYTTGNQNLPSVAMNAAGDFVVAWQSDNNQDGSGFGIYAQRYNSAGVAQGNEFRVNTFTPGDQDNVSIAMDAEGDFVVAWSSYGQDGHFGGIFAQRYNSAGLAQAGEFAVNTLTTRHQDSPTVAMSPSGDFVVAWGGYTSAAASYDTYARRYDASGTAQEATEFRVNSFTTNRQISPSVAMDASGDFVIAWGSNNQDGDSYGVYAQRYNAMGMAQGVEFRVNTHTTNVQSGPNVAMDAAGDFVVVWNSNLQESPGGSLGVYSQRYSAAGVAQGGEFRINAYTTNAQGNPAAALGADGNFVVAWSGAGPGDPSGIFARRFGVRDTPVVGTLADNPDSVTAGNSLNLSASNVTTDGGTVAGVSFYRETNGEPGLQVGAFGDTLIGTDTTESAGFWTINFSTAGLALGTYTYWAQATDDAGLTGVPASTTNTVSVSVLTSSFVYDGAPQKLRFTFNGDASASLGLGSILLEKIGGGGVPVLTLLPYGTDGTNIATFAMNTLLADGNYRATIAGVGGANVLNFFILGGDANHDRKVDVLDLIVLANNWYGTGKTFSQADFDYDGDVDAHDLGIMATHWQQNLAQPAPPLPAAATSARTATRTPVRVIELVN